jgi:hypothetical protein
LRASYTASTKSTAATTEEIELAMALPTDRKTPKIAALDEDAVLRLVRAASLIAPLVSTSKPVTTCCARSFREPKADDASSANCPASCALASSTAWSSGASKGEPPSSCNAPTTPSLLIEYTWSSSSDPSR